MGVDQAPGTTAVDTGDGTAAGVVPNTEVTTEINAVTIRRLEAVYLPSTAGGPAPSHSAPPQGEPTAPPPSADPGIETALTTLRALGYRLSTPVRDALTIPEQAWALVNAAARVTSGSPAAEYRPFYPDFPVQVHTASEDTLLVNAALHYLGDVVGVRILPDYQPSPREPLPEDDGALTKLGLATAPDLERIVANLAAQATPFSAQDRADLTALHDFGPERAPHVAIKENLAVLTITFPDLDFSGSYRTVADVLRLAVAMAGGDISLAEPCRFPSFSRAQRRRLLGLLDAVGQVQDGRDSAEEMARRSERWKRLARHLRPGDYAHRFPRAAELLRQVALGRTELGFGSHLEEALARSDVEGALRLLSVRPGVFARRLNQLLRLCADDAARKHVVAEFSRVAPEVSLPVLVRLWEYFSSPGPEVLPWRVVTIKAATGIKTTLILSTRRPGPADAAVVRTVEEALRQRAHLGRIAVDQRLYEGYKAPLGLRSASPGLRTAGRGTRLPLPEGETIRFFLHWRDLAVGVGEHQVANLDHSSNRALAHLLDLLEGRRMPLAHLLGLLADDVVEDPDRAQLVFGEGRILPWQTERLLALLDPERVTADAVSEADGGAEDRQAG